MKNSFIILFSIVTSLIVGIFFGKYTISHKTNDDSKYQTSYIDKRIYSRPEIPQKYQRGSMDQMGINPEDTRSIRESYQNTPYMIHNNPGQHTVLVNLPTFFLLSIREKNEFFEKISTLGDYSLEINIFTYSQFKVTDIDQFYSYIHPNFSAITWRFYDIPVNYYEVFERYTFNSTDKNMTIELYNHMFPDGFSMVGMVDVVDTMLKRVLGKNDKLASLSFIAQEIGDIFFMFPLGDTETSTLQNLSTKSLYSNRILINSSLGGPGEKMVGRKKIEKFFRESSIEQILLNGVGEKNGNEIILYNFE